MSDSDNPLPYIQYLRNPELKLNLVDLDKIVPLNVSLFPDENASTVVPIGGKSRGSFQHVLIQIVCNQEYETI